MSRSLTGIGIGRKSAVGPAVVWSTLAPVVGEDGARHPVVSVAEALKRTAAHLGRLAEEQPAGASRDILAAQAMMADDDELLELAEEEVAAGRSPTDAVEAAFDVFRALLAGGSGYFAARVADLDDLARRVRSELLGIPHRSVPNPGHPFILVADDLAPADTVLLDPDMVLAFATEQGGSTSHTAILARARNIPAIVGCRGVMSIETGAQVLVDAWEGALVVDPEPEQVSRVERRVAQQRNKVTGPGRTKDGHPVALLANIGHPDDVAQAVAEGAEGVGLMRTEFLFADRETAPSFEEQVEIYSSVLSGFPTGHVVARVLDAGSDKPLKFLPQSGEPNPALGLRGLRALRVHRELLDVQLRTLALAQRQTGRDLWVMAPMVSSADEALWFANHARHLGLRTVGAMVEVPAAALTIEQVLRPLEFVSIGTNDLAQYTMAADRLLGTLGTILDTWSPAVLQLVKQTAQAGLRVNKPVGVCGEAAADPTLACAMVGVGVTSLSMSPSAIGPVREMLYDTPLARCREIAETILDKSSAAEARRAVSELPIRWRH